MILNYLFLILAIVSTASGQFFYKKYSLTNKYYFLILTLGLFVITPVFSFFALKKIEIDIVYMFTSLTILIVLGLSIVFLKEKIELKTHIGILLIIVGVIVYGI